MKPQRRRLIRICALAPSLAVMPALARARPAPVRWQGVAMGAHASLNLLCDDARTGQELLDRARAEIARIERIFSLYRDDSELVRLNRRGWLDDPSPEMLELFSLVDSVHGATEGRFDPSIQSSWRARAARLEGRMVAVPLPAGWRHVRFDAARIAFERPGMALTLNGIAQGYASDRVAGLLREAGMVDLLVDVGEIVALGHRADGQGWRVGLAERADGPAQETLRLSDRAVASSSPLGPLPIDVGSSGQAPGGHIIDPATGRVSPTGWRRLSVIHRRASIADGLSTGLMLHRPERIAELIAPFAPIQVIGVDRAGRRRTFEA